MGLHRADWVFAAEARSVPQARTVIAKRLLGISSSKLDVILLLASELMTNAVRHGIGPVGVRVVWDQGEVRVEVEDQSPAWPIRTSRPDAHAMGGRGLLLVEALSNGWGVMAGQTGKTVWFRLDA